MGEGAVIDVLVWASLALLGLATYFLRMIHADIRKMRDELNQNAVDQAVLHTKIAAHDTRISRLEERAQ